MLKHRLDAHLHLQTIPWNTCFADSPGRDILDCFLIKGSTSICNGTSPLDWDLVTALAKLYPHELIPYYGVHPWYVDALPANWLENLKSHLILSDSGIGEIGLDRSSSAKSTFSVQLDVFKVQLDLAVSMNLPVSIHCVRAWGILLDILQEKILIRISKHKYSKIPVMIHSFSGSMETMNILTDMGIFVSFSPFLVSVKEESLREVLKTTPLEKILIESDFSFNRNISIYNQISNYKKNLINLYNIAGSLKELDSDYFQEVIFKNGKIFTDRASNRI